MTKAINWKKPLVPYASHLKSGFTIEVAHKLAGGVGYVLKLTETASTNGPWFYTVNHDGARFDLLEYHKIPMVENAPPPPPVTKTSYFNVGHGYSEAVHAKRPCPDFPVFKVTFTDGVATAVESVEA